MGLYLRRAKMEDMDLLFEWANDDTVRKCAFHMEKIPYEDHVRWFSKMMEDTNAYQYISCTDGIPIDCINGNPISCTDGIPIDCINGNPISCTDGIPVGQIRLNIEGNEAAIDYSVCAGWRGQGCGGEMLRLLLRQLENDKITYVTKLIGQVKYENIASARVFERSGFVKKELPEFIQYELELGDSE